MSSKIFARHNEYPETPDSPGAASEALLIDMNEEPWDEDDWSESFVPETPVDTLYRLWAIRGEFG